MLGYFVGITLVLIALSPFVFADVFADSFTVTFDKQYYNLGDTLTVSGEILDFGMPVIAMSIYDPDGKILSANNLEITPEQTFKKTISLDSPFYEKIGEYKVKLDYGPVSESYYFVIEPLFPESEIFVENFEEPEIILLYPEKNQYTDNDTIKITGLVSAIDSPTVLIGIYDPFGMPAGFYFGTINSDLEFSTSFLVKAGVNFRVDGTYSIKAHYAETEATSFFEYYEVLPTINEDVIEETIEEPELIEETIQETIPEPIQEIIDEPTQEPTQETIEDDIDESFFETPIIPTSEETTEKIDNSNSVKETKIIKDSKKPKQKDEIKKQSNLTVEDIELGKLLNQINLECDSSIFTDTISYYDGMGPALYRLCKFDSSLNFFNESLVNEPNDVEILVNKGSALGKLGYFSEAIVYYDQAINVDPSFLPAKNNKANALANLGNFDESISLYAEVLSQNPNYITAKKNLETALSLTPTVYKVIDDTPEFSEKTIQKSFSLEKTNSINNKQQKTSNFFEEVSLAFSSLGSFFSFFN